MLLLLLLDPNPDVVLADPNPPMFCVLVLAPKALVEEETNPLEFVELDKVEEALKSSKRSSSCDFFSYCDIADID